MKKLLRRKLLLDTKLFQVTDNELIDPAGRRIRRILVEHGGSTVVMPMDEEGRVLLVRQYRFPVRKSLWELPAGKIDAGETALQAARRELEEETGYRARRWKKLVKFWPSPGFQQEHMTIYLATGLIEGTAHQIEDEDLDCKWVTLEQLEEQIRRGRVVDAKTMLGVYFYRMRGQAK